MPQPGAVRVIAAAMRNLPSGSASAVHAYTRPRLTMSIGISGS